MESLSAIILFFRNRIVILTTPYCLEVRFFKNRSFLRNLANTHPSSFMNRFSGYSLHLKKLAQRFGAIKPITI